MLERGDAIDASYEGERFAFRPIGIYWLQAAPASCSAAGAWDDIATYRLPSLLAGILAVLATWWLTRPLLGDRRAVIAAALFAVSPIVALQATLSIPEGPLLLAIVVAQLTPAAPLLRRPTATATSSRGWRWPSGRRRAAACCSMRWPCRSCRWRRSSRSTSWTAASTGCARLRPLIGVPLMLAIAAPWLLIRAHFDGGVPFSGLTWGEFIRALGGAQDMKWKAAPLTFTLAFVLGFLPGALLLCAGAAEPVARARRRPAALPLRLDRRLLAVPGADRLQAGALHRAGDVPRRRRRRGAGARSRVAGGGLAKRQARHPAAHAAAACMAGAGWHASRCSPPS